MRWLLVRALKCAYSENLTIIWKRCKIGGKLVLITNRKSYTGFRLVPKSVTLTDLERRNGRYIALFHWICETCVPTHNRVDLWRNLCTSLYFVLRLYDVVVKKVHVRYLISWWVSCFRTLTSRTLGTVIRQWTSPQFSQREIGTKIGDLECPSSKLKGPLNKTLDREWRARARSATPIYIGLQK